METCLENWQSHGGYFNLSNNTFLTVNIWQVLKHMFCLIGNYPKHFKKGGIVKILFLFAYFGKSNSSFASFFLKWQLLNIQCLHVQCNSVSHSTPRIYSAIILLIIIWSFSCIEGQSWTSRPFCFHYDCI